MKNTHFHDKAYKYLLSNPLILEQLLRSFVPLDWVKALDFKQAQTIATSFISDEFKQRESDLIYRFKLKGQEVYLYLLIEFQSTVDSFFALRMLRYVLEFYDWLRKTQKVKKLPMVFPLMLYNGSRKWTAPQDLQALIEKPQVLKSLEGFIPQFRYFKLAENEIALSTLEESKNIISTVFLLEQQKREQLGKVLESMDKRLTQENPRAVRTFLVWLKKFLQKHVELEVLEKNIPKIKNVKEVKGMLSTTIEQWRKELLHEGMLKGIEKGIAKGQKQGMQQGMQQGIQQGMQQGEKVKTRSLARAMKVKGYPLEEIASLTGLSQKEIQKLH